MSWIRRARGLRVPSGRTVVVVGKADCEAPELQAFQEEESEHCELERKKDDELRKFIAHIREKIHERTPPPPPRFDFPVESQSPKKAEYRRVDVHDGDPRLRAELYPLEDEITLEELRGSYRQSSERTEILSERKSKRQPSDLSLVSEQGLENSSNRVDDYRSHCETRGNKASTSGRQDSPDEYLRGRGQVRGGKYEGSSNDGSSFCVSPRRESLWSRDKGSSVGVGRGHKVRIAPSEDIMESEERWEPSPVTPRDGYQDKRDAGVPNGIDSRLRGQYGREIQTSWLNDLKNSESISMERDYADEDPRQGLSEPRRMLHMNGHETQGYERRGYYKRNMRTDDAGGYRDECEPRYDHRMDGQMLTGLVGNTPMEDLKFHPKDGQGARDEADDDFREQPGERHFLTQGGRCATMGMKISKDDGSFQTSDLRESSVQTEFVNRGSAQTEKYREPVADRQNNIREVGTEKDPLMDMVETAEARYVWSAAIAQSLGLSKKTLDGAGPSTGKENWRSGTNDEEKSLHSCGRRRSGNRSSSEAPARSCDSKCDCRKMCGGDCTKGGKSHQKDVLWKMLGDVRKSFPYEFLKDEACDFPVEKQESVQLPVLEEAEKEFHGLVAAGKVAAVRQFLYDHPVFNINCVNYQQISALHVAVHEQNEAMVEFLLEQPHLECSDCALYAIKGGNIRIVEKIMDRMRETYPSLEYAATTHSVDFPDDMTPIILAAQLGNYEIIDFLIKREHVIPPVHNPYCRCESCKGDLQKYDRLKYSTMKLNLYKAICNPMYIFHVTDDPFQRAFDLTQELEDAAKVFPQFKSSYEELWRELRNFTVDLIGCCRNAQEVEIILKKSGTNLAGSITFPRLQYAIDLKQKEFVSHPYTQAVLVDAWTGDLLEWKVRSPIMQALSVFPRIPMLPVMAVMCMLLPNHRLVRKWKTPVNKMISSVASYLIFLIILFLESNLDKSNQKRGPPNSGLEGLIIIYVIGYIWLNIRLCFRLGPKRFFSTMWHWFDCIMLFLFTMTIIFWVASLADIIANDEIDLPRKYWNSLDPELIAEGFFAAAVIMAFFRLNMFLSLNYHLGPLQVSIGKMTLDIFRFILIFCIIILAWCAGLCRFYQPYEGMVQKDVASGTSTTQVSSFVSFTMTLKTFFWAIFGMSPIESADVVIENLPGDSPDTTIINHHEFTEAVGYTAFALFQFLSVVVVLNMLVACMANTFTKVIDNVTVEWVFGRSQIYLSFMAASTLPPPFNLLPTAAGIKNVCIWLKLLVKPSKDKRAKFNVSHCCFIENETEAYVNTKFPALMSELAQRYLRIKGECIESHDDLEELKYEMKELLRKMDKIAHARKSS